ncbi:MAG TPA: PQQ-binding-like beta-propeller repeat protein [Acidothermaceae bacterium]
MIRRSTAAAITLAATLVIVMAAAVAACTSSGRQSQASSGPPTSTATPAASGGAPPSSASAPAVSSPATSSAAPPAAVWPTYHHDAARTGAAANAKPVTKLTVVASAKLDGAIYASPLVLRDAQGPLIVAATENNSIYALRDDGTVVWQRHVGAPVDGESLPCGNIDPSGITGSPAYDPSSGLIFAVAFLTGRHHELVAVDASTGKVVWSKLVDPPGSHPEVQQQRSALLVSGGRVWVAYGGLFGDCGPYHGYVMSVPTTGQGSPSIYRVPSSREAGIWTPAGPAANSSGHIFVSVGNGAQTNPKAEYDMSDSVIEFDQNLKPVSFFAPSTWAQENARDLDLGTTGPVLLPGAQVFVAGKAGNAYLLRQGNLGGIGGDVPSIALCKAFGGAAYADNTVYVPCANGIRALRVNGATMTPLWQAKPAGSPVVGGGAVLSVDAESGTLHALDAASGATKAKVSLGDSTTRFATPALGDDGHAYVGTAHGRLVIVATS